MRPTSVIYPGGSTRRVVYYNYPTSGVGAMLSRLDNIAADGSGTTQYAQYTYLGGGSVVKVDHPAVTNGLVLSYGTGGTYGGFDRFGRIIDQKWANTGGTVKDEVLYGYDRAGNRTYRDIPASLYGSNDRDQAFGHDNLHRLVSYNRGTLSSGTITDGAANFNQQWPTLETLGNWRTFRWDADGGADTWTTQSRSHNKVNEIDTDDDHANTPGNSISGTGADWFIPKYDAAGNMIQMPMALTDYENSGMHVNYDAWNRMVEAKTDAHGSPGSTIATYRYDGNGRRIQKTVGNDTFDYYYNEGYQLLEVRKNGDGDPLEQYAWDISYIDAPLVRWHDSNTDGTVDDTLYPTRDANFNVTALVDASGTVQERYLYDPYGKRAILDGSWAARGSSTYEWSLGHQGLMHDSETGLIYNRARMLHPTIGRFVQRDAIGYARPTRLYIYVSGDPLAHVDPLGLREVNGIDITKDFCECYGELDAAADWARKMQDEYTKCGQAKKEDGAPQYTTGDEIEKCVKDSLAKQGITTVVAGTTDSGGNITVPPQPGKCGPLLTRGTTIHEESHSKHVLELLRNFGRWDPVRREYVKTAGYYAVYNSANDWWRDEVNAYGSEIPFYDDVMSELEGICCEANK